MTPFTYTLSYAAIKSQLLFLLRDAMHSAPYAVVRCLSVRASRSCTVSISVNKMLKFLSPSGSPAILVFRIEFYGDVSTGISLTAASLTGGYWKIVIVDQCLALSLKTGSQLLWDANANSYAIYQMLSFLMTLIVWFLKVTKFVNVKQVKNGKRQL